MGRKRTPTALKVITGTARADRLNEHEARPELAIPTCPAHLSTPARTEWKRVTRILFDQGLLSELDRGPLAAYCEAYGVWVTASKALRTAAIEAADRGDPGAGLVIKTAMGNEIQNPMVGIANRARLDLVRYAAEFGMTPAARSKVKADPDATKKDAGQSYFT